MIVSRQAKIKEEEAHQRRQEELSVDAEDLQAQAQNQNHQLEADRPKRNPFCSRCRNHGKSAQVKGHKRHCEYRNCQCEGCKLVECRQVISAAQIKRRREQKQDEESGRKIEISPPILAPKPDKDPATLIAKTLVANSVEHTDNNLVATTLNNSNQHVVTSPHLRSVLSASNISASNSVALNSSVRNNLSQHDKAINIHNLIAAKSPTNKSFSEALQILNLPGSVINPSSLTSSHGSQLLQHPIPVVASSSDLKPDAMIPTLPSFREQIALVDEIYQSFGPLAIYAWLKVEQFDLQRVRDLIEISRASFESLLDASKCHNFLAETCGSMSDNSTGQHHPHLQQQPRSSNSPPTNFRTYPPFPVSRLAAASSSAAITTLSASPQYTFGTSDSFSANGGINFPSNNNKPINSPISTAAQHYNLALASTINSFPMSTAQSLLWPGLKLGANGAGMIHPHHLFPHFIQNPFVTHPTHPLDQQTLGSPSASTLTNSSSSASSSSTAL